MDLNKNERYLSVTQLSQILNQVLEEDLGEVTFQGEISEFTCAQSGHCYFTIKDQQSQLSAVMWRSVSSRLKFHPKCGDLVVCTGIFNVYNKTGRIQVILQRMVPAGEGELKQKFEELKLKLEREGLFAQERKRPIPFFPKGVGVVTSKSGAVIHDIMTKIHERLPNMQVYLVDARVQGEGAAQEIARGVELLNRSNLVDVIIVARGGGSLEDLWAFNEEPLVRAVFASRIPVISGVGHEVDFSLCDMAADLRAPTPTAAAEMAVPKKVDLLQDLSEIQKQLLNYDRWLQPLNQNLDEVSSRFNQHLSITMREAEMNLTTLKVRINALHPHHIIKNNDLRLQTLAHELQALIKKKILHCEREVNHFNTRWSAIDPQLKINLEVAKLSGMVARLKNLAPQRVLQRGYALVESEHGIVRDSKSLAVGDKLKITVAQGKIAATVNGEY
ncbi:MAG: exodeoxyribonuclease VII large subunit [Bdellovibrionota bacterium]|jgi:exodeoxyribonuclease VII large subunit